MRRSAFALRNFGKIRVGLIGNDATSAARHVAALGVLSDYELVRNYWPPPLPGTLPGNLSTISASATEVTQDPLVDLVVIVSGTPRAHEVVREAILAGKDIYCDWPIETIAESADEIAALARQSDVSDFVGLQFRLFPAIRYMRDLVARGYCGKISSLRLTASSCLTPASAVAPGAGGAAVRNPGIALHLLDAAFSITGRPKLLSGVVGNTSKWARLPDPTQFCMMGKLKNDAIFSAHLDVGAGREACLKIEIYGDEGRLELSAVAGELSSASLIGRQWKGDVIPLTIPREYQWVFHSPMPSDVTAVANLYAAFAQDLHEGTHLVPDLEDGLQMNRLLGLALELSERGHRVDRN